jgi:hypothetical protein
MAVLWPPHLNDVIAILGPSHVSCVMYICRYMTCVMIHRGLTVTELNTILLINASYYPLRVTDTCSSVSLVSDCGLDDRGSIPDRGRGFFL